jgi:hypothetical protein
VASTEISQEFRLPCFPPSSEWFHALLSSSTLEMEAIYSSETYDDSPDHMAYPTGRKMQDTLYSKDKFWNGIS